MAHHKCHISKVSRIVNHPGPMYQANASITRALERWEKELKHKERFFPDPPASGYAKRMNRLSNRIFNEVSIDTPRSSLGTVRSFMAVPYEDNDWYNRKFYPNHPMFNLLVEMLRKHGLYRDEHLDFREEMERQRRLRGKVKHRNMFPDMVVGKMKNK